MLCLKFSLILILLSTHALAGKFTSRDCLVSEFETKIQNAPRLFGLIKNEISIKKNKCDLEVVLKDFFTKTWQVDICREPIHFKLSSRGGAPDIFKRHRKCLDGDATPFCEYWRELNAAIQDYGLVFAKGVKEDIKSDHGQFFCTYLLLQRYLDDGILFSSFDTNAEIFKAIAPSPVMIPDQVVSPVQESDNGAEKLKEGEF